MKIPRKMTVALLAGVSIAGIAGASAASLGNTTSSSLGSGSSLVASCDTNGVSVSYTTAVQGGKYVVTAVTVSNVDANCDKQTGSVTLTNTSGSVVLGSGQATADKSGSFTVTLGTPVDAALVENAAVLIAG
jgi:hypothetical protein